MLSKHLLHGRHANIFNPAALALVVSDYLFTPGQDWWGAQPARPLGLVLLGLAGAYVVRRVNRLPALLWFLGAYFLLFTVSAYFGDPRRVAEIYRLPDLGMVLFFAFFMVTDPPTSPRRGQDQIVFGLLVAGTSFAVFELAGPVWFLLAGLLVGNGWEALRRWRMAASRADS
ncbi:MAG TPA: RnfABCDGE type electron transport complex subunit D [Opitutus sp.]|nr:RnfABCDGE type electron transport complex subunit D [Opitutus sp.]